MISAGARCIGGEVGIAADHEDHVASVVGDAAVRVLAKVTDMWRRSRHVFSDLCLHLAVDAKGWAVAWHMERPQLGADDAHGV